jgi:hypothetical protein
MAGPPSAERPRAVGLYRAGPRLAARPSRRSGVSAHSGFDPSRVSAAPFALDHAAHALTRGRFRAADGLPHACSRSLAAIRLAVLAHFRAIREAPPYFCWGSLRPSPIGSIPRFRSPRLKRSTHLMRFAASRHSMPPAREPAAHSCSPCSHPVLVCCPLRPRPADQCATVRQASP